MVLQLALAAVNNGFSGVRLGWERVGQSGGGGGARILTQGPRSYKLGSIILSPEFPCEDDL